MRIRLIGALVAAAAVVAALVAGAGTALPTPNAVSLLERGRGEDHLGGVEAAGQHAACSAGVVHAAMYDAVAAIEGGLEPFMSHRPRRVGALRGRRRASCA